MISPLRCLRAQGNLLLLTEDRLPLCTEESDSSVGLLSSTGLQTSCSYLTLDKSTFIPILENGQRGEGIRASGQQDKCLTSVKCKGLSFWFSVTDMPCSGHLIPLGFCFLLSKVGVISVPTLC